MTLNERIAIVNELLDLYNKRSKGEHAGYDSYTEGYLDALDRAIDIIEAAK